MPGGDLDMRIRLSAFDYLAELVQIHGEVLPAGALRQGFEFQGQRVPLKGIQGIFKPAALPELPLSITTAPPDPGRPAPYDDGFTADGSLLVYRYRGTDPQHHENVGLRRAMRARRPLVYFHGVGRKPAGSTSRSRPGSGSTSAPSGYGSCGHIASAAPSAGCSISSFSMQRTSCPTLILSELRSSPTAWPSA